MAKPVFSDECPLFLGGCACPFGELDGQSLTCLQKVGRARVYEARDVVFHQGSPAKGVLVVCAGMIKRTRSTAAGRSNTLALNGLGSILGLSEVMAGRSYETGAVALTRSVLRYVSTPDLQDLMRQNAELTLRLLRTTCCELMRVTKEFSDVIGKVSPAARLLDTLEELARACGRPTGTGIRLAVRLTEEELAERIGCSRQWTCRLLQNLEINGVIRRGRGWIEVSSRSQ